MKPVIQLQDVKKIYQMNGVTTPALRGVNLTINKGEFLAIMGPSGSGKSTLLHMIGALDKPTSGKIILDGVDTATLKDADLARLRGKKIGFVFQFFNLHPTLTAIENIELPMMIAETDKKQRHDKALQLLKAVNMTHRANHLPSQMSGGEQQRIAIARALANDPEIILADELTGNLDSKTKAEIMDFLIHLQQVRKMTVTIITHEPEIAAYAQSVVRIVDGQIAQGGT